jgi:hypothetical protein
MNKKHISLQEASSESGRSYWRLREAVLRGELRAMQFTKGGKYYVRPGDLEAYFDAATVSPLSTKAGAV